MTRSLSSQKDADIKLAQRIDAGKSLGARRLRSRPELAAAQAEEERWSAYNLEVLRSVLRSPAFENEYLSSAVDIKRKGDSFPDLVEEFQVGVQHKINTLISIKERLDLMGSIQILDPNSVFLVHGHDAAREAVARFIENLGIKVIILDEQATRGRTIIEQFEKHSDVGFAVILLTPDDIGASLRSPSDLKPRARQNVIFELGYFCGSLGRSRVCALYKGELELPSDFMGILYLPLDNQGAWRLKLFKELSAAGMSVNPSSLI